MAEADLRTPAVKQFCVMRYSKLLEPLCACRPTVGRVASALSAPLACTQLRLQRFEARRGPDSAACVLAVSEKVDEVWPGCRSINSQSAAYTPWLLASWTCSLVYAKGSSKES